MGEAPDVEFVYREGTADLKSVRLCGYAGDRKTYLFEVVLHVFEAHAEWDTLKEDLTASLNYDGVSASHSVA